MKRNSFLLLSLLLNVFLIFTDCSKKSSPAGPGDNSGLTGDITTGGKEIVASQTVGAGGGTISISKAGDPLDRLEITIPQGAFSDTKNITVSEAPIVSHEFGENFHPISPVITVQNVSGYADDVITVKIPVVVPENHVAIGALYDEKTGDFECIPLIDQTENSVTLATRTFIPSASASVKKGIFKSFKAEDALSVGNLLVLSLEESKLKGQPIIDTGFKPGVDDWEFVNNGSYIAPGGHCAGQSVSAMWYYYEKKLRGAPPLYNQFDKVQSSREVLWQDNTYGYRLASTVQKDINWSALIRKLFVVMRANPQYNSLSWKCFALSMFLTGEPQYVGLESADGAHAIIAYKIDYNAGLLYVADPNYPSQERTIKYNGMQFEPYSTKLNANEPDEKPFTGIGYFAKSTFVDWDKIGSRWSEFENFTVGNDQFPQYRLWVTDDAGGHELAPSEVVNADSTVVQVQWGNGSTDNKIAMTVFDNQGNQIVPELKFFATVSQSTIKLKSGENILGFHVWGDTGVAPTQNWRWLDFRWIPVIYSSLAIEPDLLTSQKDVEVTFTAMVEGSPPDYAKYLWNFGDGTSEVSMLNNPKITHTYTVDGDYTVTLRLYDSKPTPEKLLGTATASVKIGGIIGELRNILMSLPGGYVMYGLDIEAGLQDDVALVTDEITLYVKPRFTPSSGGSVTGDIPVDYIIYLDGSPVKNGVVVMEPTSDRKNADGYAAVNIGRLSKGSHTIRLVLDPDLKITDPMATDRDTYRIIDHEIRVDESYF